MAARKRVRGARPAAGAAAGRKGTTAAAKLAYCDRCGRQGTAGAEVVHNVGTPTAGEFRWICKQPFGCGYDLAPVQRCGTCGREGTTGAQVVHTTCAGLPGMWHCNRGFGCMTPEVQAALDAISNAGLDEPLPLEVSAKGTRALCDPIAGTPFGGDPLNPPEHVWPKRSGLSSTHPCTGSGCLHPLCDRSDRCATPFDPLRNYAPPPSLHMGKPGLYLDVDLDAAPPLKVVSLDPDRSWQQAADPMSDIMAGIAANEAAAKRELAGAPVLRSLLGATREQAEAQVAKLEQVLLGRAPDAVDVALDAAAARIEQRLEAEVIGPLRAQLANAQQTARNVAERFRYLGTPLHDPEVEALLQQVRASHPAGAVIRGLGVDPGYAHLGFVAVDFGPSFVRVVHREKLNTDTALDDETRLNIIAAKLDALVYQLVPHFVAYENVAAVHAGREGMLRRQPADPNAKGKGSASAQARRQLEVCGMIRSSTQRYGCAGYTVMPGSARRGVLGKGNTKGATKKTVRTAVERILGVRGLSLELSDAAAIVLAGYGKHREATLKGRRRRR